MHKTVDIPVLTEKQQERFWKKVVKTTTCWNWIGNKYYGYGYFHLNSKKYKAHRVSWILSHGEIQDGSLILHSCDNRACVNPYHLKFGTQLDNIEDAISKNRLRHGISYTSSGMKIRHGICIRNHRISGENLYVSPRGQRRCRACFNMRQKMYMHRHYISERQALVA